MFKVQQSSPSIPTNENPIGLSQNTSPQRPGSNPPVDTNPLQQNDPIITMKKVRQCAFKGAEAVSYVLYKVSNVEDPYGAAAVAGILAEMIDLDTCTS